MPVHPLFAGFGGTYNNVGSVGTWGQSPRGGNPLEASAQSTQTGIRNNWWFPYNYDILVGSYGGNVAAAREAVERSNTTVDGVRIYRGAGPAPYDASWMTYENTADIRNAAYAAQARGGQASPQPGIPRGPRLSGVTDEVPWSFVDYALQYPDRWNQLYAAGERTVNRLRGSPGYHANFTMPAQDIATLYLTGNREWTDNVNRLGGLSPDWASGGSSQPQNFWDQLSPDSLLLGPGGPTQAGNPMAFLENIQAPPKTTPGWFDVGPKTGAVGFGSVY